MAYQVKQVKVAGAPKLLIDSIFSLVARLAVFRNESLLRRWLTSKICEE